MAKNYTLKEVVEIINEGKDMEAIADIGRRFPTLLHKVTKVTTLAGEAFVDLMGYMPDYLTANKVNTALKSAITSGNTENEAEGEPDTAPENETEETTEDAGIPDYESMSGKQLWDILGKAGLRKTAKSTKKADLVEACKAMHNGSTEDAEEEVEADADASNPYEGKSAMELFKECKARGIKAAPKKTAKFYADLLIKADAEAAEDETESDDWDEEEDEAPKKPAKKAEKPAAKPAKKAAKKEEAEDDDDWDI